MRFALTSDQELFGKAVREVVERECGSAALRAAWESADGRVPGLWGRLAELGVMALAVPEDNGGLDGDEVDLVPVLEETGRVALPEPLLGTVVGARVLAAAAGDLAAEWLPRVAAGEAVLALGAGPGALVADAACADLLLLRDGADLHAVPRDAVSLVPQPSADTAARLARVQWSPSASTAVGPADPALDGGALAAAAQLVGLAQGLLEMAVRYAGQRVQFGRPIGSFQAVKHQLADVYVGIAFARPVVARAAWSVARGLPTRTRDVSMAKHAAAEAAGRAARTALQVHGGIGYTYEHDLHMWAKRVWTVSTLFGDAAWHRARVAAAVLDTAAPRVP